MRWHESKLLRTMLHAQDAATAAEIISRIKQVGYEQVDIDPQGYRQGSLNVLAGIALAERTSADNFPQANFRIQ